MATMQGALEHYKFLMALSGSMVLFWPQWKARIQLDARSALIGIVAMLVPIGYMAVR